MRKFVIFGLVVLAGCGGGGSSVSSPYAGSWVGTSLVTTDGIAGLPAPCALVVSSSGAISGDLTGTISPDGRVSVGYGFVGISGTSFATVSPPGLEMVLSVRGFTAESQPVVEVFALTRS